jgi:hypothetical protein
MECERLGVREEPRLIAGVRFEFSHKMPVASKVIGRFRVLVRMRS